MPARRPARVSVIVPVRDEERLLPGLLDRLQRLGGWHELIVADGGSRDACQRIVRMHAVGARLLVGGARHERLNSALRAATGDVVIILAADARPARGALAAVAATTAAAGCLSLRHARRSAPFRLGEAVARLRARWTRGAYLDQAPFFARSAALAAGGFRAVGAYDSSDLGRRLRRHGTFAVLRAPVVASCRAWRRGAAAATFLRYQRLRLRRLLGGLTTSGLRVSRPAP